MAIDFNLVINRRNTNSSKWDRQGGDELWDRQGGDYLPLWLADMDFSVAEPILAALRRRLEHPVFGYTFPPESAFQAVIQYYRQRYQAAVPKEWLVWGHGVNMGNNIAARMLGGSLMVCTPLYPHINLRLPWESGLPIVRVPLREEGGRYSFDFAAMEAAVTPAVTTFFLCNPHNPVGRVYTRGELEELLDFAVRHQLVIVADEIHSDLILEGRHIPAFTLGPEAEQRVIVHHSASKTYNLPGLPLSFAVIPNPELRRRYRQLSDSMASPFGVLEFTAVEAAFNHGRAWLQQLLLYLRGNYAYLAQRLSRMPGLKLFPLQGTYLAWVDARGTGLPDPQQFFLQQAGVHFNNGTPFSAPGFIRINFACPRATLAEACDRIEAALAAR